MRQRVPPYGTSPKSQEEKDLPGTGAIRKDAHRRILEDPHFEKPVYLNDPCQGGNLEPSEDAFKVPSGDLSRKTKPFWFPGFLKSGCTCFTCLYFAGALPKAPKNK